MRLPKTLLRTLVAGAAAVVTVLPAHVAHAEPSPADIASQIEKAAGELEDTVEAYNGVSEDLKTTQAAADAVSARVRDTEQRLSAAQAGVAVISSTALRSSGSMGTVSVMLSSGSSDNFVDQLMTMRYVNRNQQREIKRFAAAQIQLRDERARYDTLITQKTAQQRQLADRKSTIEAKIHSLEAMKERHVAAGGTRATSAPDDSSEPPPAVAGGAAAAVSYAYSKRGAPYVWGAAGPNSFDCSGLTMAAWAAAGVRLPHNAAQQYNRTARVSRADLQPGDLVFYRSLGHVAIYVGSGKVIHAPTSGDVVKLASVDMMSPGGYGRPG